MGLQIPQVDTFFILAISLLQWKICEVESENALQPKFYCMVNALNQ